MENTTPLFRIGNEGEAMGAIMSGMHFLADSDAAQLPASVKAGLIKDLERADALETIARAHLIWSFDKNCDYEDDGQRSVSAWLMNEMDLTRGEAGAHRYWTRTVLEHPAIAGLLADGLVSKGWLTKITAVTNRIREDRREEAEKLIAQTAREANLNPRDLLRLANEIRDRAPAEDPRDDDPDRSFEDRSLRLELTLDGAGVLTGQLSETCAAALDAMLTRLAVRCRAEDTRSHLQRQHDALEEMCHRLLGTDLSAPAPGGTPAQMLVMTALGYLRDLEGASAAERAWIEDNAAWFAGQRADSAETGGGDGAAWVTGDTARDLACDAALFPMVLGHVDAQYLDQLIAQCIQIHEELHTEPATFTPDRDAHKARIAELMRDILGSCAKILGGEPGLAAHLRRNLLCDTGLGGRSLPLDIGDKDDIPWHIRKAVALRDAGRCQWPGGCDQPGYASEPHHLIPRACHGPTSLCNLLSLCWFHHHIAVHKWGWTIKLHGDATATATSPDGTVLKAAARPPPPPPRPAPGDKPGKPASRAPR